MTYVSFLQEESEEHNMVFKCLPFHWKTKGIIFWKRRTEASKSSRADPSHPKFLPPFAFEAAKLFFSIELNSAPNYVNTCPNIESFWYSENRCYFIMGSNASPTTGLNVHVQGVH